MNARMLELLDLLAQREREEDEPSYIEILPPLRAVVERQRVAQRTSAAAMATTEELEAA